jgi:hypothetical protein
MKYLNLVLLLSIFLIQLINCYYIDPRNTTNLEINSFAFGSCFYGRLSTRLDIFKSIQKEDPKLWMWLGDAAYVDRIAILNYYKSSIDVNFTLAKEIFDKSRNNECKIY